MGGCHVVQMLHWYLHPDLKLRPRHAWMAWHDLRLSNRELVAMFGYTAEDWEAMAAEWKYALCMHSRSHSPAHTACPPY